jgi:hypothetical protein
MDTVAAEQTLVTNEFGTVTTKRVIYQRSKGWFRGGSREDIPLKHVTSVRLDIRRHVLGAILVLLLSVMPLAYDPGGWILTLAMLAWALLLLWGSPAIVVNTAGQDLRPATGAPWQRQSATEFVDALRAQLVRE